jgi:hypothetical protein
MHMAGESIPHAMQCLRSLRREVNRTDLFRVFMIFSYREANSRYQKHEPACGLFLTLLSPAWKLVVSAAVPTWPAMLIVSSLRGLTGKSGPEGSSI